MLNKKAFINWQILVLGVFICIGIFFFYSLVYPDPPKPGKFSTNLIRTFEKNSNTPLVLDNIMKETSRQSITNLNDQVFHLKYDCGSYLGYKLLNDVNSESCIDEEANLKDDFEKIFEQKITQQKSKILEDFNLDFSNVNYKLSIKEENDKYFMEGKTNDKLETPIKIIPEGVRNGVQIGKIFTEASFKVPIDYDFDEYEKLIDDIGELINECKDEENAENCVKNNKNVLNERLFELIESCETEEKEKFLSFVEYFEGCIMSDNVDCECKNKPEGEFSARQLDNNVEISGKINDEEFKEILENIDLKESNLRGIRAETHLIKDGDGEILVSSEGKAVSCGLKKTKYRFCVKSNKNKYYDYDEDAKKLVLKDVVYKFALQFI